MWQHMDKDAVLSYVSQVTIEITMNGMIAVLWAYLPVIKQSSTTDSEFRGVASLTKGGFQEAPHT